MNSSKPKWYKLFTFNGANLFLGITVLCLITSGVLGSLLPRYIAELSKNYSSVMFYDWIYSLLGLFLGIYINRVIYEITINKYIEKLTQSIRVDVFEKWLLKHDSKFSKVSSNVSREYPQGEVLARIMSDTESLRELVTSGSFGIFIDIFFIVSALITLITINTFSGVVIAIMETIATILLVWGSKYMRKVFNSVRYSRGYVSRTLANVVGGVRELFYTDNGKYASKKSAIAFDDFLAKQIKSNFWDAGYYAVAESTYPLFLGLIVLVLPYSRITEIAVIFVIIDLIQRSIGPIKEVAGKIANIQRAATGVGRIFEFFTDLNKGFSSSGNKDGRKGRGKFNGLTVKIDKFSYKSKDEKKIDFSLSDVNFTAKTGDLIGIVGLSGCGKSTVLNIVSGNIIPDEFSLNLEFEEKGQSVFFDGTDLRDFVKYRENVGIISQDSHIFSETLAFNICLDSEYPDDLDEFWLWLIDKISYFKSWGISLNDVVNPNILSAGQKQLLSAIRSCYLKKTVVLFDEISSALDSELEEALREVILLIQKQSLTIVVTHRLETIIGADSILVMDGGRLIDRGCHTQLLEKSTVYSSFVAEMKNYS